MFFGSFYIIFGIISILAGLKIYKPFKQELLEKGKINHKMFLYGGIFMVFCGIALIYLD